MITAATSAVRVGSQARSEEILMANIHWTFVQDPADDSQQARNSSTGSVFGTT